MANKKAQQTVTIQFQAKGERQLTNAIMLLDKASKSLTGTQKLLIDNSKRHESQQKRQAKQTRILGGTFAVLRSKILLFNFAMGLGIRQLGRFGAESAKVESMKRAFDTLAGATENSQNALKKLEQATNGTMSQFDLFQQANNAMILGVSKNSDEMAEMFDIAQRLGRALGRDTASSVESLITGIGRQSRLMLDNIGIIVKADEAYESYANKIGVSVDKLTDADKKQAFLTATMESARAKVKTLGDEVLTSQDVYDKLKSATSDLATATGNALQPALLDIAKAFTGVAESATKYFDSIVIANKQVEESMTNEEKMQILLARKEKLQEELSHGELGRHGQSIKTFEEQAKIKLRISRINKHLLTLNLDNENSIVRENNLIKENNKLTEEETEKERKAKKEEADRLRIKELTNKAIKDGLFLLSEEEKAMFDMDLAIKNIKINAKNIPVERVDELTDAFKATNVSLDFLDENQKFALKGVNAFSSALAQATIHGQNFGEAVVNSLKAIASQLIAQAGAFALLNIFTGGLFGKTTSFLKFAGFAHTGGYIKEDKTIQRFATGGVVQGEDNVPIMAQAGEFVMSRNAVQSIGVDNLAQMNKTGNAGITVNISAPLVDETVIDTIIPAIEKAQRMNLA
jgi:hypothetical protein